MKTALITGGARRIGRAISQRLHQEGYCVIIHCNTSRRDADELAASLNAKQATSAFVVCRQLAGIGEDFARDVLAHSGQLDLLVNNASTFYPTPPGESRSDLAASQMDINFHAPLRLIEMFAGHLRDTRGAIVNITDVYARLPLAEHSIYSASKSALTMLTRTMAMDLAPHVRVNAVAPGAILWPEENEAFDDAKREEMLASIPLGRFGMPEDIASAVAFLATGAAYITGQTIAVSGGLSR